MAGVDAERYEALIVELRAGLVERDARLEALSAQVEQLTRLLDEARRAGKRQASPFSKGDPELDPKTSGRKSGRAYGKRAGRAVPDRADRELDAVLASSCPDCGGTIVGDGVHDQWVCEVPKCEPVVTRFRVHVGRCSGCARRVQGRHPEQASDALGAAGVQLGPRVKAVTQFLHYQLGLSFARCADALRRMFGLSSSRAALCRAADVTGKALATTHTAIEEAVNTDTAATGPTTAPRHNPCSRASSSPPANKATTPSNASSNSPAHPHRHSLSQFTKNRRRHATHSPQIRQTRPVNSYRRSCKLT